MDRVSLAVIVVLVTVFLALPAQGAQGPRPPQANAETAKVIPPVRMFDNLYYIGNDFVCAYLLKTSEGLIVIDSLYGEFINHTVSAIEQLGFNPKDVRYVLVTHGHEDHFGGAAMIQRLSGARVVMTDADWKLVEGDQGAPRRDMVARDGETLTLGDTTVKFHVTPGHTPGVLSMEFTVFEGKTGHKAFLFGGANVTSNRVDAFEMFVASVKRLKTVLSGIDVNLASHPWQASILERAERLKSRRPGGPNPFVAPDDFKAFLDERLSDAETRLEQAKRATR